MGWTVGGFVDGVVSVTLLRVSCCGSLNCIGWIVGGLKLLVLLVDFVVGFRCWIVVVVDFVVGLLLSL